MEPASPQGLGSGSENLKISDLLPEERMLEWWSWPVRCLKIILQRFIQASSEYDEAGQPDDFQSLGTESFFPYENDRVGQTDDFQSLLPCTRGAFSSEFDEVGQPDVSESADLTSPPFTEHPRIPNLRQRLNTQHERVSEGERAGVC